MMSERWQRELQRLRSVHPDANVWDRAQDGPPGDRLPPRRQRLLAGVVALVVFIAAGGFAYDVLRPRRQNLVAANGSTSISIDIERNGDARSAVFEFGGESEQGLPANAVLSESHTVGIASQDDGVPVPDGFASVPADASIDVGGNGDVQSIAAFDPAKPSEDGQILSSGNAVADVSSLAPGRHSLAVFGSWSSEGVEPFVYVFGIDVEPPAQPTEGAMVTFWVGFRPFADPDPMTYPRAELVYGDSSERAKYESYDWRDLVTGSSYIADTTALSFSDRDYVSIPAGTPLQVRGALQSVSLQADTGEVPLQKASDLALIDGTTNLDLEPGRYVLAFDARWAEGRVPMYLAVEVVPKSPAESPAPSANGVIGAAVLTISDPSDPKATLSFGEVDWRARRPGYTYCGSGDGTCGSEIADFSGPVDRFMPIPAGTPITIEGDATSVTGTFGGDPASDLSGGVPAKAGHYVLDLKAEWPDGNAHFSIGIEAIEPASDIALACPDSEQIAFGSPKFLLLPLGEAYIRGNVAGIERSDDVQHVGPSGGQTGDEGTWTISRDGSVIAWADYPAAVGRACMGTGIGGA